MNKKGPHKVKFLPITEQEKRNLKNKIFASVRKNRSRKKRTRFLIGSAASLLLIVGTLFTFHSPSPEPPSIMDFVNSTSTVDSKSEDVLLMLGEQQSLNIDEKITTIQYSGSGKNIKIGSTKTVSQELTENQEPVFNTLIVPFGKRSKITLSDGSQIWLNSGSRMVYPATFHGKKREVYIEGEAIFDVAHSENRPFIVISQDQEIEVLGTVFGVTNYLDENRINTVLKSGSVQISYHNNSSSSTGIDKVKISPGTKASYDKQTKSIVSEKVNVDTYFSWRDGFLIFKNNDLEFIMRRVARYYNKQIRIGAEVSNSETFSGYLNLNEDIEKVIQSIKESTNINYEFKENEIVIH